METGVSVATLIAQLGNLLVEESKLLRGVGEQAEWIERELRLMHEFLEYFEALEGLSKYENELVQDMRAVATDAEDIVETLTVKSKQRRKWGPIRRFASVADYIIDSHIIAKKMEQMRSKMKDVFSKIDIYDVVNIEGRGGRGDNQVIILEYEYQEAEASSSAGHGEINVLNNDDDVSSKLSTLLDNITTLLRPGLLFNSYIKKKVETLKEAFKSLQSSWEVIKSLEGDERWKAWMNDTQDIICYADGVIGSFLSPESRDKSSKSKVFKKAFFHSFEHKLGQDISKIKDKINEVIQRKQDYGIGEIRGRKSSSSMVLDLTWPPPGPVEDTRNPTFIRQREFQLLFASLTGSCGSAVCLAGIEDADVDVLSYLDVLRNLDDRVESLSRDLRLMHALFKDVNATKNLDANLSAWVDEMRNIARDAEAVISSYIDLLKEKMWLIDFRSHAARKVRKIMAELDRVKEKIRDAGETRIFQRRIKTAYMLQRTTALPSGDQGEIAVTESAHLNAGHGVSTSFSILRERLSDLLDQKYLDNSKLIKKAETFRRECGSFISFWKEIELLEPDERLKAWIEDMRNVACYANKVIESFVRAKEQHRTSYQRNNEERKLLQRIGKIEDKIKEVFHRKQTYGIGEIRGRKSSSSVVQDLKWQPPRNTSNALNSFTNKMVLFYLSGGLRFSSFPRGVTIEKQATLMHIDDEIESLCRELRLMNALFKDVEAAEGLDNITSVWVEELQRVARDIEAVINTYSKVSEVADMSLKRFRIVRKVAGDIDRIKTKICDISERRSLYGIEHWLQSNHLVQEAHISRRKSFNINKAGVIGSIDEHVGVLKTQLLDDDKSRRVISITGTRGIGKTTLAKYIYHDNTIMEEFHLRAWVSVGRFKQDSLTAVVKDILEQVMSFLEVRGRTTVQEDPMQKLKETLAAKRYLIVLDDIQTTQVWDSLKEAFPEDTANGSGGRIMFTSCNLTLASLADFDYRLPSLCDDVSLKLFTKTLKMEIPPELQELGKGILLQCHGLPQAITTMGNLLSEKDPTKELWSRVLEQLHQGQKPWQRSLDLISKDLPSKLRRCFRYFSLFPADYDIPVRRLIALWISEGLLHQKRGENEPPEYVGERYLMDLIDRNMVRASKRNLSGKVKTCRLAEHLKEFWLPETKRTIFFPGEKAMLSSSSSGVHYLADHCDNNDPYTDYIHGTDENSPTSLRPHFKDTLCFLSFDSREGNKPGEDIEGFLERCIRSRCFQKLRILDLERVFRPNLPKILGKLTGLKYLGLRWTYIETLPSSISNLLKLQTLDVKHTYISELPGSIWNMQQLRHLYLSESYRSRFPPRPSGGSLDDLQTLWGVFVDEESPIKNGLDTVVNLKKLGVACRLMLSDRELMLSQLQALGAWLGKLKDLESLRLRSYDEQGRPWFLPLKDLSCLTNLSSLYLLGKLRKQFAVSGFPLGLTELTLSASKLKSDPMRTLQHLQSLKMLGLFFNSYIGKRMCCSPGGFLQLEVLKVWKLEQLEEWVVEEGALPKLRGLEVRSCMKLNMLPAGLLHVATLQVLLSNMPAQFTAKYIQGPAKHICDIKKDDWPA